MTSKTIVFIHGMYMNSLCWERWVPFFEARGYDCLAPDWPGRDKPVHALREIHPDPALGRVGLKDVVSHHAALIAKLPEKPILIGHSMGALTVQLLVQQGLAAAAVAIDSAPPAGVFTTKWSFLKSNWPHITPFVRVGAPIAMTFERFQYTFVNGMPLEAQKAAFERYVVPESRLVPRQSLAAKIDFKKPHAPLLLIGGGIDHIIPASLNRSNHARYAAGSVTDFQEFAGRNHFLIGQDGWEEVATFVAEWLAKR